MIKQYPNVKFSMKNGKRYLNLPDSPRNDSEEKEINPLTLAAAKRRIAKRNFKTEENCQSPVSN